MVTTDPVLGNRIMATIVAKPQFDHACPACHFLGQYQEYDLYFCVYSHSPGQDTVIARYGSNESEYVSGLGCVGDMGQLTEAARRAVRAAYINPHQRTGTNGGETVREAIDRYQKKRGKL